jgi:hypothetical protein
LRVKYTGQSFDPGFSKVIIKDYYKNRLDQLIEDKRNEEQQEEVIFDDLYDNN